MEKNLSGNIDVKKKKKNSIWRSKHLGKKKYKNHVNGTWGG